MKGWLKQQAKDNHKDNLGSVHGFLTLWSQKWMKSEQTELLFQSSLLLSLLNNLFVDLQTLKCQKSIFSPLHT